MANIYRGHFAAPCMLVASVLVAATLKLIFHDDDGSVP